MKKTLLGVCILLGTLMSSCTLSNTYVVTGDPIGSKTGVAKFSKASAKNAAANGKISKVGAIQVTTKLYLFVPATVTKVYGE